MLKLRNLCLKTGFYLFLLPQWEQQTLIGIPDVRQVCYWSWWGSRESDISVDVFLIQTDTWLAFILVKFYKMWAGRRGGGWLFFFFFLHMLVNVHQAGGLNKVEEMQSSGSISQTVARPQPHVHTAMFWTRETPIRKVSQAFIWKEFSNLPELTSERSIVKICFLFSLAHQQKYFFRIKGICTVSRSVRYSKMS